MPSSELFEAYKTFLWIYLSNFGLFELSILTGSPLTGVFLMSLAYRGIVKYSAWYCVVGFLSKFYIPWQMRLYGVFLWCVVVDN